MRRSVALSLALFLPGSSAESDDKPSAARLEAFVIEGTKAKAADSDAPLAEGWPKGTEPGRIEVKAYPAYRSAVNRGKEGPGSDTILFFPLFNHIKKSEIAMTSPVVMNLPDPSSKTEVTMEFVYRSPTMGQVGPGLGPVKVEDHPATTYACLGVQGDLDPSRSRQGVEALEAWLGEHKTEWVADGPPRRIGYHGPMTPRKERLWEVQIPVKPVSPPGGGAKP